MAGSRYYLPPRSRMPEFSGNCAALLCIDTIYTMGVMPHYTQYWDYWATLLASLALSVICHVFIRRKPEMVLLPAAAFAIIGCAAPSLIHWMEVALFFLLLLLLLLRLPAWAVKVFRGAGIVCAGVGILASVIPMVQRIFMLSEQGTATAKYILTFVLRTLGSDPMCLLAMLFLVFAFEPHVLPGWMDEEDKYDRIWE